MISFITGKPGGGKGLLSQQQVVDELVQGKRHIITNLAIRIKPWIFGDGTPMVGLQAYLQKNHGKDFDCENRIHVLDDEEIAAFYLWRVVDGQLVRADAETVGTKDGEQRVMGFDTALASQSGGVLYVVDEAWKFFSSRSWQKTGEGALFYGAQHRKFGDDVFIVTQHTKQIDPAIQRVAQDFWVVKNHSKMSIGLFRQPDVFSVAIYDQPPTGATLQPMSRRVFRLDKKGLAQTYDTSAGVGLTGRFAADVGARRKGLPFWMLLVAIAIIAYLAFKAPSVMGWVLGRQLSKGTIPPAASHRPADKPDVPPPAPVSSHGLEDLGRSEKQGRQGPDLPVLGRSPEDTNSIYCTGFCLIEGDMTCFFSDGSTAYSSAGEVQTVQAHWVVAWGRRYRVVVGRPVASAAYEFQQASFSQYQATQVSSSPAPAVNQAIILPAIHDHFYGLPAPQSLNGVANMQQGFGRPVQNSAIAN